MEEKKLIRVACSISVINNFRNISYFNGVRLRAQYCLYISSFPSNDLLPLLPRLKLFLNEILFYTQATGRQSEATTKKEGQKWPLVTSVGSWGHGLACFWSAINAIPANDADNETCHFCQGSQHCFFFLLLPSRARCPWETFLVKHCSQQAPEHC